MTTLFDLIDTLGSSLHSYLVSAGVWTYPGAEAIKLALVDLVDDQRSIADRAGRLLEERGGVAPRAAYPIRFTATHDADLGALLPRVLEGLRRQLSHLDRLIDAGGDAESVGLVREAREATLQHGDALEELVRRGVVAPPAATT
jgi:hypothetical protein